MGGGGGIFAPLRDPLFRRFWLANLVSNLGWLVQSVAAAWLMTSLTSSPEPVALVQSMTQLPMVMVALFAGAAADLFDRRRLLIAAQLWMMAVSIALALGAGFEVVTPFTLLLATFLLGMGAALNAPTFQVLVAQMLKPEMLAAAITINAVAFNLARAVGPGLGGSIIVAGGVQSAFVFNALSYLPLLACLLLLRLRPAAADMPKERVGQAIATGFRYVVETASIWHAMGRAVAYGFAAPAILALLPVIARERLESGPLTYGMLLGAFGIGALLGALAMPRLRRLCGIDRLTNLLVGATAGVLVTMAFLADLWTMLPALALAGACWLSAFSTFAISVQIDAAPWVQARVVAIHQMFQNAAMALGAWVWGAVAEAYGLPMAFMAAAGFLLASLWLAPLLALSAEDPPDFSPADTDTAEQEANLPSGEGPVLLQYEYRVDLVDADAFVAAMDDLNHVRRRNGAVRWRLFQDASDPQHWLESFLVEDDLAYRRFRARSSASDAATEKAARAYQIQGHDIVTRTMVARRRGRRFTLDAEERKRIEKARKRSL